jgi:hypothetical protein
VAQLCKLRAASYNLPHILGGHRPPLQLYRHTHEFAPAQSEAPQMMRGTRNPDTSIGHNIYIVRWARLETVTGIDAQIHFMIASGDIECLGKFAGARTEFVNAIYAAALFHERNSTPWFKRTDQNETILFTFDEHIQHPVHAIVEIDICCAGFVALDERAGARSRKSVRGFVVYRRVGFSLDDNSCAFSPDKLRTDQFARTTERVAPEESPANHLSFHEIGDALEMRMPRR